MAPSGEWVLGSTSGYSRLLGSVDSEDINGGSDLALMWRVRLEYVLPDEYESPAIVEVPRLQLDPRGLRALGDTLRSWLAQPLGALAADTFAYSVDLAAEPSDRLLIDFGERTDLIIGVGGVGCLVELAHSSLTAKVVFVTDPTCLQILAEGIEGVLSGAFK
jgi:hypothetical protein